MTNLKEINFGLNQFCGPAVLSAITGESTDRCAAVISAVSGKNVIKGVKTEHLKEAFRRLRFDVTDIDTSGVFSGRLYGTLMELSNKDGFYIIIVPHHFVAIEAMNGEVFIVDTASKVPLPANSSARLMQKVEKVFKVSPRNPPKFVQSKIEIQKVDNRIDIISYNYYSKQEDNTQERLGEFRFRSESELLEIITLLRKKYMND